MRKGGRSEGNKKINKELDAIKKIKLEYDTTLHYTTV
jgi:hypothetical protein